MLRIEQRLLPVLQAFCHLATVPGLAACVQLLEVV